MRGPSNRMMRAIPQKYPWTSSVFISEDGLAFRRHFNVISKVWVWEKEPIPGVETEEGRIGYMLDHWTSVERCIAVAWLHRDPFSKNRVVLQDGRPPHIRYVQWSRPGSNKVEGVIQGERWSKLRWWVGAIRVPDGYKISTEGRLMTPSGEITKGHAVEVGGEMRLYAGTEAGLVDLTTASGERENTVNVPPRLRVAVDALMSGHSPSDLANATGLAASTCWSYFTQAAPRLPPSDLRRLMRDLVPEDLWGVLRNMEKLRDELLGGTLTGLDERVLTLVPLRGEYARSENRLSKLRLARIAVVG